MTKKKSTIVDIDIPFHEAKLSKKKEGKIVNTFLPMFVLARSRLILISKFFRRSYGTMSKNNPTSYYTMIIFIMNL
jgi:hypothetical protein